MKAPTRSTAQRCARGLLAFPLLAVAFLSGCQGDAAAVDDAIYAEVRLSHRQMNEIELVAYVKTASQLDCTKAAQELVSKAGLDASDIWKLDAFECRDDLQDKYRKMFDNQPLQATYMRVDRTDSWSHDLRMIMFGLTSATGLAICNQVATQFSNRMQTKVACVKGTIG